MKLIKFTVILKLNRKNSGKFEKQKEKGGA